MAEETITAQTPEVDPGMSVMPEGPGLMDVPTVIPELGLAAQALASQVSFAKKTWKDGSGGGTPVTAAELNRLEQGVADLTAAVNALRDSVSQRLLTDLQGGQDKIALNYLTKTGMYTGFDPDNAPSGVKGSWVTVFNIVLANNTNFRSQLLWNNAATPQAYLRSCSSGSWGEWVKL